MPLPTPTPSEPAGARTGTLRRALGAWARAACLVIGFAAACQSQDGRTPPGAEADTVAAPEASARTGGTPLARPRPSASACTVAELARFPIVLPNGLHAYVEPQGFHRAGDGFVLVGAPTYEWTVSPNGAGTLVHSNRILGVVVQPGAEVRAIPPLPTVERVGWVRSALHDDGRLSVLAGALHRPLPDDSVARVVYAELEEGRWSRLDTIASPSGGVPWLVTSSELVRMGEDVAWAAIDRSASPEGPWPLVVHRGRAGSWTRTTPMEQWPDRLFLHLGPAGLVFAVAGLDPAFGDQRASLALFDGRSEEPWLRIPAVDGGRVRSVRALNRPDGIALGWLVQADVGWTSWAATGVRPGARPVPHLLDEGGRYVALVGREGGGTLFIVDRPDPLTGGTDLRLHLLDDDGASLIGSMPKPYTGPFAALPASDGEILLVGPEATAIDAPFPFVRSLVIRLSISC